jgi:hypothetical protein
LTRAALQNHAARHEIQEGGDAMVPWWQLDIKLEETYNKLDLLGYYLPRFLNVRLGEQIKFYWRAEFQLQPQKKKR